MFDPLTYSIGFALFFFAAFTKGMIGFGVNVVSVPIMSLLVGPKAAVAIVSLPSFLNNVILVVQRRDADSFSLLKRIWRLLVLGFVGIALGSLLLVVLNTDVISVFLGLITVFYVLSGPVRQHWQIPAHQERFWAPLAGFGAGVLGGVSGISAPILVAYLYSLKLTKREFVYTISIIFILFNGAQGLNLWLYGVYTSESALYSISYIIPIFLGTIAGTKMQENISQKAFERLVLLALLGVGLDLIRRGLHLF